ncbi:5867_t:CDS:10 [Diversispora eburnea]|uniref:2-(3-amino-3-carboxypropyl)histidine synthase subunit 2 n=1 Tax=Diversispora eburnea TaxID=1213867 RepID=A0A9N8V7F6_9GLOM|nr:5867_t:CDS:10 [Diversispora eburnea]
MSNIFSDGSAIIERITEDKGHKKITNTQEELESFYEIEPDSVKVATTLGKRTNKKFFILADTTYGSCCVDEVAAQHVNAECIIHYGRSCLRQPIDLKHCLEVFDNFFGNDDNSQKKIIIILYDVVYAHCIEEEQHSKNESVPLKEQEIQETIQEEIQGKIQGRSYSLPKGTKIEDCTLFYIGEEGPTLTNILLTYNKCNVYSYNSKTRIGRQENLKVNRALMKRFYMVQKAKDANIIGIVVGTLGVGRKPYTFVMGKLNVEKMANFMEIDCFVLVACPENSLIDSKEFYRPIVTPFELEIALDSSKQWTGEYILEFRQLLSSSGRKYAIIKNNEDNMNDITDLTLRDKNTSISTVLNSAAGEFLNSIRTFKGLEQNIGNSSVQLVEEGRTGIAKGYVNEDN